MKYSNFFRILFIIVFLLPLYSNAFCKNYSIFSDGFETGDVSAWSLAFGDTGLAVNTDASLSGTYGLEVTPDSHNPLYLGDNSPNSVPHYSALFSLDVNNLLISASDSLILLQGKHTSDIVFELLLIGSGSPGQISLQLRTYDDLATQHNAGAVILDAGVNTVEIVWKAASHTLANDGVFRLIVNNIEKNDLINLDNDTMRIDSILLGSIPDSLSSLGGSYYVDNFISWQERVGISIAPIVSLLLNKLDPPFGSLDTPVHGSTVNGTVPVTGWALDRIGIESVKLFVDETYIGDAYFVEGARPDVALAYPGYPNNTRAGFVYNMVSHFLPNGGNGSYTIKAKAYNTSGVEALLGSKSFVCDNVNATKPFGNIDTPNPGETISGTAYINWGWALTPQPNSIAIDGSTIKVYIDGVHVGQPTYNIYRSDIASDFSGYANSNGAGGSFTFDTTAYENGVHSINWVVQDNVGNVDSIGSRYFTVQNP